MLVSPTVPQFSGAGLPDVGGFLTLPIVLEFSPLVLVVLGVLAGIFLAALSVILIYHWRRFPFERATFQAAERVYTAGLVLCAAVAVVGILIS